MKIYLLFNNQRIAKKKTHVKKRTLNPVFNESFVFDLPKSEDGLASVQLEFMLLDWDRVTKNEVSKCRLFNQFFDQRVLIIYRGRSCDLAPPLPDSKLDRRLT